MGPEQALGKDRREPHAEPSHPIPQLEGNNQKTTKQQKPPLQ